MAKKEAKVKMRKIDIRSFKQERGDIVIDYPMKQNLKNMLMFRISGSELYDRIATANKIMVAEKFVHFSEEEWSKLEQAIRAFPACTSNDEELVKRVLEAEKVEMEEKKEG